MKEISVVIPSYNSARTIGRTLESLAAQRGDYLREIILVDSSDDGKTPGMIAGFTSQGLRVLRLEKKTMPATARNLGAAQAGGAVLAFIDSDAYAAVDWLERIWHAYEDGCRAGGGAILLPEFQRQVRIAEAQYYLQFNEFMETGRRRVKTFVPSCNLFCDAELFKRVGGFPEIRASEDVLFGLKVGETEKFFFDPRIRVYHIFREEKESYLANQRLLGEYILIYRRGRGNNFIYKGPWPALLLPAFVTLKFFKIAARIALSGRPGHLAAFARSLPLFLQGLWHWAKGFLKACGDKA